MKFWNLLLLLIVGVVLVVVVDVVIGVVIGLLLKLNKLIFLGFLIFFFLVIGFGGVWVVDLEIEVVCLGGWLLKLFVFLYLLNCDCCVEVFWNF